VIRQAFLRDINQALGKSGYFRDHDFDIRSTDRSSDTALTVQYRYDTNYVINVAISKRISSQEDDFAVTGTASPGDMSQTEQFTVYGRDDFLGYVSAWANRLKNELDAIPVNRQLDEQRHEIDAIYEQFGDMRSEYFSRDEAEHLKTRLAELEQHLKERVAETTKSSAASEARIAEMTREFAALKNSVDLLKKPGWFKSFSTYMASWLRNAENRAILKDGADIVKGLLE
jgi:hypothetical protein